MGVHLIPLDHSVQLRPSFAHVGSDDPELTFTLTLTLTLTPTLTLTLTLTLT